MPAWNERWCARDARLQQDRAVPAKDAKAGDMARAKVPPLQRKSGNKDIKACSHLKSEGVVHQ